MSAVSVCLSVCQTITFESLQHRKLTFAHSVYLQGILVKFVHEGHGVKDRFTGAKNDDNPHSRNVSLYRQ